MEFFKKDSSSVLEAIDYAQHIAFAPVVFQATRALRNLGLLKIVDDSGKEGITFPEVVEKSGLSEYNVRILMEAGLGIRLLILNEGRYRITRAASYLLHDSMTRINMDFVNDVCYQGMFELDQSIVKNKPEGLKHLGPWNTIYEGLSILPEPARTSWFNFDHFYSDGSFPEVLPIIFDEHPPKKLLDIGGNTGKWTLQCLKYNSEVEVGIVDLPVQLNVARKNLETEGMLHRVKLYEVDLLDEKNSLPRGYDIIWMSQFLDCFSEPQIFSILQRCYEALEPGGQVMILEPLWDRQQYPVSAFCLQMTSLYFTNIANGNSQMYHSDIFVGLLEKAGFTVEDKKDHLGHSNTLLMCRKK
jgi:ubiquinone/menaquinone biosynthesis C-methylase UbiE